jgi:hypothetical protein
MTFGFTFVSSKKGQAGHTDCQIGSCESDCDMRCDSAKLRLITRVRSGSMCQVMMSFGKHTREAPTMKGSEYDFRLELLRTLAQPQIAIFHLAVGSDAEFETTSLAMARDIRTLARS